MFILASRECNNSQELNAFGAHVVCQRPDGKYVDIHGAWTHEERWGIWKHVIPVTEQEVKKIGWDSQNVRNAMCYARRVVKIAGPGV